MPLDPTESSELCLGLAGLKASLFVNIISKFRIERRDSTCEPNLTREATANSAFKNFTYFTEY